MVTIPEYINVIESRLETDIASGEIPVLKKLQEAWKKLHFIHDDRRRYREDLLVEAIVPLVESEQALEKEPQIFQSLETATANLLKIDADARSKILERHAIKDEEQVFKEVRNSASELREEIAALNNAKNLSSAKTGQSTPDWQSTETVLMNAINTAKKVYKNIKRVIFLERETEEYLKAAARRHR